MAYVEECKQVKLRNRFMLIEARSVMMDDCGEQAVQ